MMSYVIFSVTKHRKDEDIKHGSLIPDTKNKA